MMNLSLYFEKRIKRNLSYTRIFMPSSLNLGKIIAKRLILYAASVPLTIYAVLT